MTSSGRSISLQDLQSSLARAAGVPPSRLDGLDRRTRLDSLGLDSLAYLQLQFDLLDHFGVHVSDEAARQMPTVGDVLDYLNARLDHAGGESKV
jgi:acyl carrier protein